MSGQLLIYGAGGYIGRLTAKHAVGRGLDPILAGRRRESIADLADELGAPVRVAPLEDPAMLATAMNGIGCVLNCAGPFGSTASPLANACIESGIHYLDLAGEVPEFESLLLLDDDARDAGSMVMPGVGFGVVPTDCLAVRVQRRLPSATRLQIGFETVGGVSRGTASVVFGGLLTEGVQRRGGELVPARPAEASLEIELGGRSVKLVTNPWRADLISAHRSTGIPEIETYIAMPPPVRLLMSRSRQIAPLWGSRPWQSVLNALIARLPEGPSDEQLTTGSAHVWARADDLEGGRAECRLSGPEAYLFSALTAVEIADRAQRGIAPAGFQTPATAYGPDLVECIDGVEIDDL